jgi:transcriptional regulator with XRE-family HTH domain
MSNHEPGSGSGSGGTAAAGNELGAFLRSRREAVSPAAVGLPAGGRRRTPGLRRAELATLAGISVDYLVRLEQGRDRHPSTQVLAAIADVLRLPTAERVQLRLLAKVAAGHDQLICPAADEPSRSVRPTVRALLDRLEPAPASVVNRLGDVLAHTTGYARLAGPIGLLEGEPPNLTRFLFTDERARTAFPDWDRVADQQVSSLRLESSRPDPHTVELVEELTITAGAAFTDRMTGPPSLPDSAGVLRVAHPEVGELRLAYETLELSEADAQRLIAYLPADEATSATLDRLTGRHPGALRAVTG